MDQTAEEAIVSVQDITVNYFEVKLEALAGNNFKMLYYIHVIGTRKNT